MRASQKINFSIVQYIFLTMDEEPHQQLSLIYFRARGLCQNIRMVLYEIGTQFEQIFLEVNEPIPDYLRQMGVDLKKVPCIISEGKLVHEYFPIVKYLCRKYNRMDLLGKNIQDQGRINEIMTRYVNQKCKIYDLMFNCLKECMKNPKSIPEIKAEMLEKMLKVNTYLLPTAKLYIDSGTFLFGYMTILDFVLYESCFYFANIYTDIKKKYPIYITYKNFFQKTDLYKNNKEKIEKYSVLMPQLPKEINEGFKLIWMGDPKYLS